MKKYFLGCILLIGLVSCANKSDLQILNVTAPSKVLAGQGYQVTIDIRNNGADKALNAELQIAIVNTHNTRLLFGNTEKDVAHIDLPTIKAPLKWVCKLQNSVVRLHIVQPITIYKCNALSIPKGDTHLTFTIDTPTKLQDFKPLEIPDSSGKLDFTVANYHLLTHIDAVLSVDTVRANNAPLSSTSTEVTVHRPLGTICENDQYCDDRDNGLKAKCRENVCVPADKTGKTGEYCHHNNHCQMDCSCKSGQTDVLGWCPDWESKIPNDRGTCK